MANDNQGPFIEVLTAECQVNCFYSSLFNFPEQKYGKRIQNSFKNNKLRKRNVLPLVYIHQVKLLVFECVTIFGTKPSVQ